MIDGVTDECTIEPIVQARVARGAVDCSPEYPDEYPVPIYIAAEQPIDERPVIECIGAAVESGRDAVYLSQLVSGTDSLFRSAKLVSANGSARLLSYDSSSSGQGIGGNTVVLLECAPFGVDPTLRCSDERSRELVCTHDERVRATFR